MTRNACELARTLYDAFSRGDIATVMACLDTDIEWTLLGPSVIPYFGTYRGHEGVQQFFGKYLDALEILEFAPEEFIDAGDRAVVLGRERCVVRSTGKEYQTQWAHVYEAKNGKLKKWTEYIDTVPMYEAFELSRR